MPEKPTVDSTRVLSFTDTFTGFRAAGTVIGTSTEHGAIRRGVDVEGVIGIDNGALRIQPLIEPGWGRAGISYMPYARRNGLAVAVHILNGHNTAQSENLSEPFLDRLQRWRLGSETVSGKRRLVRWLFTNRKARAIRQFQWWRRIHKNARTVPRVDENLAVGWFPLRVPEDPGVDSNGFIMHATGPENGELWVTTGAGVLRAVRGVQNLQIYYVVILRERGAAYYVASVPGAKGLAAFPMMRPIAVDAFGDATPLFPSVHQSVLGQIGFRLDTRVYGVTVNQLDGFSTWYGTAHVADQLVGTIEVHGKEAQLGGRWRENAERVDGAPSPNGMPSTRAERVVTLDPCRPSGLIHALIETQRTDSGVGIVWRYLDADNYWRVRVTCQGCDVMVKARGFWSTVAFCSSPCLSPSVPQSLQVHDDGACLSFHLQGQLLFGSWFQDGRLSHGTAVGFCLADEESDAVRIRSFEAHSREVAIPSELMLGEPWFRKGRNVVVMDDFRRPAGDLQGTRTSVGDKTWNKVIGTGAIELTGHGTARIRATAEHPNPGRTAYTIKWDSPKFADLEVTIIPPGREAGRREHGLCGFVFWQDPDNYITVNIWVFQSYAGASVSCFFQVGGFEDLYDAIWSNVGSRIYYGVPVRLRIAFDSSQYLVFLNDEPVLYRALTDVYADYPSFRIEQVGLLANWEWGNDTGSTFRDFVART